MTIADTARFMLASIKRGASPGEAYSVTARAHGEKEAAQVVDRLVDELSGAPRDWNRPPRVSAALERIVERPYKRRKL
jgi:hypothetical protein